MKRYPLDALVEATGLSEAALGRRVGLSGSTLKQARLVGFTESAADRYACRAGFHPYEVWPDWLDDTESVCEDCGTQFVPSRRGVRFCSKACNQRAYKRRRYWEDPAVRAAANARAAAWRAQNRELARKTSAIWRRLNPERAAAQQAARRNKENAA